MVPPLRAHQVHDPGVDLHPDPDADARTSQPAARGSGSSDFPLLVGVGYIVPALIAHDMGRQGIRKTIKSVMLAGLIVAAPIGLALLVGVPGVNDLAPLRGGFDSAVDVAWIPIVVLLLGSRGLGCGSPPRAPAAVASWAPPSSPSCSATRWQVAGAACVSAVTYVIIKRLLMNSMILFGRRKFSAMLLVLASLSWSLLWFGSQIFTIGIQSHMDTGSPGPHPAHRPRPPGQ